MKVYQGRMTFYSSAIHLTPPRSLINVQFCSHSDSFRVSFAVFDSCLKGKPFKFRLGAGEVIKGWDVGVEGMKVGGKRRLTIPPQMAYGAKGAPPDIPANSHLVFEVECKAVN